MGFSDANYHFPHCETLSINSKTATESDRPADQDILESIQAAYFSMNDDFDICKFELEVCVYSYFCVGNVCFVFVEVAGNFGL